MFPWKSGKRWEFSDSLLVGEFLAGILGLPFFMSSFGICGPTRAFVPAMILWSFGSTCTAGNLVLLAVRRQRGQRCSPQRWGWVWAGIPMVLITILLLYEFQRAF